MRVETERRQKALEAELGQAEQAKKERSLSVKYHKVKFFGKGPFSNGLRRNDKQILERQKVTRKLKQTKKRLEKASSSDEKASIVAEIHELSVDLNYILV